MKELNIIKTLIMRHFHPRNFRQDKKSLLIFFSISAGGSLDKINFNALTVTFLTNLIKLIMINKQINIINTFHDINMN